MWPWHRTRRVHPRHGRRERKPPLQQMLLHRRVYPHHAGDGDQYSQPPQPALLLDFVRRDISRCNTGSYVAVFDCCDRCVSTPRVIRILSMTVTAASVLTQARYEVGTSFFSYKCWDTAYMSKQPRCETDKIGGKEAHCNNSLAPSLLWATALT
jgi:hypothetical protein